MANIEFKVYSAKEPINLNVRFYHNKIDVSGKTNIFVNKNDVRLKRIGVREKSKNSVNIINQDLKEKTDKLSNKIKEQFAIDYSRGNTINSIWLKKIIDNFHNRATDENDTRYFLVPFIEMYIDEASKTINPLTGKKLDKKTITRYKYTLNIIKNYENHIEEKLRIENIDLNFHNDFLDYLLNVCVPYGNETIKKFLSHIKQFLRDARTKGLRVSPEIDSPKFTFKSGETIDTYLNEEEIEKIYNLDLSENQTLHDVRDLFIAGLRTGLRISDLKRINTFEVSEGRIKITEIEKTDRHIIIPLHPQLKSIIEQREGTLPEFSEQRFNEKVKDLCKLAQINEVILGSVKNAETKRKEKGYYPKWKLIASHTCRRSFVTNLYGKLDDITIMAITGHKKHSQFLDYVKTTNEEHIQKLEEHWKKNNSHE